VEDVRGLGHTECYLIGSEWDNRLVSTHFLVRFGLIRRFEEEEQSGSILLRVSGYMCILKKRKNGAPSFVIFAKIVVSDTKPLPGTSFHTCQS
jgi:hypothetical protein